MRKFLVKNFVGSTSAQKRILRVISTTFLIPVTFAIFTVLTGSLNFKIGLVFGLLALLSYYLPIGQLQKISRLRASKMIYPIILVTACLWAKFYSTCFFASNWWYLLWLPTALSVWIGFDGYKLGYFDLFPVKPEELDEEQKGQFDELKKLY